MSYNRPRALLRARNIAGVQPQNNCGPCGRTIDRAITSRSSDPELNGDDPAEKGRRVSGLLNSALLAPSLRLSGDGAQRSDAILMAGATARRTSESQIFDLRPARPRPFVPFAGYRLMGLYAKYVLPRIIDLAMSNPETRHLREAWIPQARGEVLEVGIGSGLNLQFYSPEVQRVYGVDPSIELQRMARKRVGRIEVEFLSQPVEEALPLEDASIDTVVLTWTLCSIGDPERALGEMKRVLKPSGRLIFVEHGRAPDAGVAQWQDRLTPLWKRISGGCHLNRRIDEIIKGAGFEIPALAAGYIPGPRPMTYTYQGIAHSD